MKKEYMDDCPVYLKEFLMNLRLVRNRADRTEEAYYIDLRTFLRYLKRVNGDVSDEALDDEIKIADVPISYIQKFTLFDAYQYLNYLKEMRDNSTATRARKTSALKQFFVFLHKKANLISENPLNELERPQIKNKLPKYLSLEDSKKLLGSAMDGSFSERNYCILTLFLNCGMRLSELVGIDVKDYNKETRTLRLFGKGSKERIVYLNDACLEAIEIYETYKSSNEIKGTPLFLSSRGTRISKRRVQQIVEESLKNAGLANTGVTTHKLRHTAATLMYQYGNVDPLVLKEVLGHKSIATTEIYTHLSNDSVKTAIESSPLSDMNVNNLTNEKGDSGENNDE